VGYAQPLWGKFSVGGLQSDGLVDEEDGVGTESPTIEGDWAAIAECWLLPEFRCAEHVAQSATNIFAADMVVKKTDKDVEEIFAKGAIQDAGVLGACMGTMRAKSGHLFKYDRTASRFSSLFADFGVYDVFCHFRWYTA
jgi:hypothetical protein